MYTVPLLMSSGYSPYGPSSYSWYGKDGNVKTYIPPNPVRTHISPLGTATFSDGIIVSSTSTPIGSRGHVALSPNSIEFSKSAASGMFLSPTSSVILSPYAYTTNPSEEYKEYRKKLNDIDVMVAPRIVPTTTTYIDVNSDPSLQKNVSKHFYEKFFNNWIHDDFADILDYFIVKNNGKVSLVSRVNQTNKTTAKNKDAKISHIEKNIMTKYDVRSFLKKFVTKTGINWYDLQSNTRLVKKTMHKRLVKTIEKMIEH